MPRRRMIDPSIWDDPDFARLSEPGRLFWIGCFSNADDDGRLLGSPAYLRSVIFKYDDKSLEQMEALRDEVLTIMTNLVLYTNSSGVEYLAFVKWEEYQSPTHRKPSKLPPPPQYHPISGLPPTSGPTEEELQQDGTAPAERLSQDGSMPAEGLRQDGEVLAACSPSIGKVSIGKVSIDKEPAQAAQAPPAPLSDARRKIFEGLKLRRGYSSPQGGAEAAAITWMLKQGYTVEHVLSTYDRLKQDTFWRDKYLNMQSLKAQIGEMMKGGGRRLPTAEELKRGWSK